MYQCKSGSLRIPQTECCSTISCVLHASHLHLSFLTMMKSNSNSKRQIRNLSRIPLSLNSMNALTRRKRLKECSCHSRFYQQFRLQNCRKLCWFFRSRVLMGIAVVGNLPFIFDIHYSVQLWDLLTWVLSLREIRKCCRILRLFSDTIWFQHIGSIKWCSSIDSCEMNVAGLSFILVACCFKNMTSRSCSYSCEFNWICCCWLDLFDDRRRALNLLG